MKKALIIFGTRPEAIKLAPVYFALKNSGTIRPVVCVTGQHREMLRQVLEFFGIRPDFDLDIMKKGQNLFDITADVLRGIQSVFSESQPDVVVVQGDTSSTFTGALAAFYNQTPVAHVEAGLRSARKYSPFPEEINRTLTGHMADFHFAPTRRAMENLRKENITRNVYITGNTAIDALMLGLELIKDKGDKEFFDYYKNIDFSKNIILVTGHRRESFGEPFRNIAYALRDIALENRDYEIVYPVHFNPNVRRPVEEILSDVDNIHLIEPVDYEKMIWLMNRARFVITDSGGIQEEAPSLGKPVLVMREVTERQEGVEAGTSVLVGSDRNKIVNYASRLIEDSEYYDKMARAVNPYGDGSAAEQISELLAREL
jgi:UDP-N-acetylglucosamine 2-epimerase (non-hydrolysing)